MNAPTEPQIDLPDINEIMRNLPHRYPMLLIDRVVEFSPRESLVGIKNVTINEPYFAGHFPQKPVMPGVLILESMAQACGMLAFKSEQAELGGNHIIYLVAIDKARFKRPVEPGDQMRLETRLKRVMRGLWMFEARALVDGALVAEAEIRCTVKEA
ncbi:3-hydroxyacyl-[acyl-carrier-protein] dehydratase [Alkalispirillum mobile]|uniref:3-hydroxyacyl-[acyl-carrier-protein] dehydratase FabZ n=1 Tax=Alkalispirillum mobile TaxID=85925 RepID=A0A498C909_9GAMM|nr:3-hydroxyacyl-ACP dehydratase FabZ [Alkalispirillum mobile]RLK50716.1 3-hydroxyacyl-[acyl-carrier-protein] dehydratase [Alkalispirillum mobile]